MGELFLNIIFIVLTGILIVITIKNPKDVLMVILGIFIAGPVRVFKGLSFLLIAPIKFVSSYKKRKSLRKPLVSTCLETRANK